MCPRSRAWEHDIRRHPGSIQGRSDWLSVEQRHIGSALRRLGVRIIEPVEDRVEHGKFEASDPCPRTDQQPPAARPALHQRTIKHHNRGSRSARNATVSKFRTEDRVRGPPRSPRAPAVTLSTRPEGARTRFPPGPTVVLRRHGVPRCSNRARPRPARQTACNAHVRNRRQQAKYKSAPRRGHGPTCAWRSGIRLASAFLDAPPPAPRTSRGPRARPGTRPGRSS